MPALARIASRPDEAPASLRCANNKIASRGKLVSCKKAAARVSPPQGAVLMVLVVTPTSSIALESTTPTQTLVSSAPSSIGQAAAGVARRPAWPCSQPTRQRAPTRGRIRCPAAAATAGDRRRHTSRAAAADRAFAGPGARVRKPPTMTPPRVASFLQPANLSTLLPPPPPRARGPGQSPLRPHRRSASISGHLRRHASYTTHRSIDPLPPCPPLFARAGLRSQVPNGGARRQPPGSGIIERVTSES